MIVVHPLRGSLRRLNRGRLGEARKRGMALLMVLASLVLLSALAVAFLLSAGTEMSSSSVYANGVRVKLLSDTAVNMVIGQIEAATSGVDSGNNTLAWASQPGMIRTYNTGGSLYRAYKLYSSSSMVTSTVNVTTEADDAANWSALPAYFTDLNQGSINHYPILDPTAVWNGVTGAGSTGVEGFSFGALPPGITAGQMPVRWLYVLKNGEIVPPDAPTGATTIAKISGASASDPIVGRIAFWTDDECSKVNINTASYGVNTTTPSSYTTFWDTPRVTSQFDLALGENQPTLNEFQRYPGHPATTSLGTALPAITTPTLAYQIAPRVQEGGSRGGTVPISSATQPALDNDRLYASTDELVFNPARGQQITDTQLEQSRFFITAHSRAPEVNLFNQPRIAMWPENISAGLRSVEDTLIAFCSTISGNPYYFQRSDPVSPTNDLNIPRNQQLYQYLQKLTTGPVPGFGGLGFATKYGTDRDQILTEILDYIRCVNLNDQSQGSHPFAPTGQVTPLYNAANDTMGFGRFPLVREACLVFVQQGRGTMVAPYTPASPETAAAIPVNPNQWPKYANSTNPTSQTPPNNTRAIQAFILLSFFVPSQGWCAYTPDFTVRIKGLDSFTVETQATPTVVSTSLGFPPDGTVYVNATSINHQGPWGGDLDPRNMVFQKIFTNSLFPNPNPSVTHNNSFPFFSKIMEIPLQTSKLMYFTTGPITVSIYAGNVTTATTATPVETLTIPFPSSQSYANPPIQPDKIFQLVGTGTTDTGTNGAVQDRFMDCNDNSLGGSNANACPSYGLFDNGGAGNYDVGESMVSATGDVRLLLRQTIAAPSSPSYFRTHPNWEIQKDAYSFSTSYGTNLNGSTKGKLVNGASYYYYTGVGGNIQGVNVGMLSNGSSTALYNAALPPGDWDNGVADCPDGPYINKPDEGSLAPQSGTTSQYLTPYFSNEGSPAYSAITPTFFSPNRQIPSSGMLGSLPTGVKAMHAWQTLLFHPDLAATHPGSASPSDHLMMDLFWMPVVEPYPISEPFSTAGKINMNCQIMPFSYINRETAIRAVLKSERILAVPAADAPIYKSNFTGTAGGLTTYPPDLRVDLDLTQTLKEFEARFASNDIFRSASEICTLPLIPQGSTYPLSSTFWSTNYPLTGDNSLERPYTNIYPRLTTKSNTYTVHYRVQALQKIKNDPNQGQWVEGTDLVTGEYRGSSIIERYLDPNATIPDYATAANSPALSTYYKFRVLSTTQFNP